MLKLLSEICVFVRAVRNLKFLALIFVNLLVPILSIFLSSFHIVHLETTRLLFIRVRDKIRARKPLPEE